MRRVIVHRARPFSTLTLFIVLRGRRLPAVVLWPGCQGTNVSKTHFTRAERGQWLFGDKPVPSHAPASRSPSTSGGIGHPPDSESASSEASPAVGAPVVVFIVAAFLLIKLFTRRWRAKRQGERRLFFARGRRASLRVPDAHRQAWRCVTAAVLAAAGRRSRRSLAMVVQPLVRGFLGRRAATAKRFRLALAPVMVDIVSFPLRAKVHAVVRGFLGRRAVARMRVVRAVRARRAHLAFALAVGELSGVWHPRETQAPDVALSIRCPPLLRGEARLRTSTKPAIEGVVPWFGGYRITIDGDGNCYGSSWFIGAVLWAVQRPARLVRFVQCVASVLDCGAYQHLSGVSKVNRSYLAIVRAHVATHS